MMACIYVFKKKNKDSQDLYLTGKIHFLDYVISTSTNIKILIVNLSSLLLTYISKKILHLVKRF